MMTDIPAEWAALAGASIGVLGTCLIARWQYLAGTVAVIRKERIAKMETALVDLLSGLQILAISCRHNNKSPEEEIDLYERARSRQNLLLVLLDPSVSGVDALLGVIEEAFGRLTTTTPPSKEDIASFMAKIVSHGRRVVYNETTLLRKCK